MTSSNPTLGVSVERKYTDLSSEVWDSVEWERRTAEIGDGLGNTIFKQENILVPKSWSQQALNIVASKYFRGHLGTDERESSVCYLIQRVSSTIAEWGFEDGYFLTEEVRRTFEAELTYLLLHQMYAFNSPVWFNVGVEEYPQCSACFINSVEDTMESILELCKAEARIFKGGSGAGVNLSNIRGTDEPLTGGGRASGPVSFMKGFDAFAGVIKSGGKTRRAAKIVILDCDHPDIEEFINCKPTEEKKAWALIEQGYNGAFTGEAYGSVFFQNANHSIRVTDEFMQAVVKDADWTLRGIADPEYKKTVPARNILMDAARATHVCGDPGIQYESLINLWHTCKNTAPITSSNPCSEFMFLENSACNLGSLNLLKFKDAQGEFDIHSFKHACHIAILAQEILIDRSSYPTRKIAENSHDFRPLGLGYANLGALLMSWGLPYDSDAGRSYAAAITALMSAESYLTSAEISRARSPFNGFSENREPMLQVIQMHLDHARAIKVALIPGALYDSVVTTWEHALQLGQAEGYRNSQVSLLAPTSTIAFMMDCDTTGVEPDIALVKYKRLVGGGMLKIVNSTLEVTLQRLGYSGDTLEAILTYIHRTETIEGAPSLQPRHLPIFDCALKATKGMRSISPSGHVRMMAVVQPFLSGAISKTVNVSEHSTPEDIFDMYMEGWRLGLKSIAIYRNNSKKSQPLSTDKNAQTGTTLESSVPTRTKLPSEREGLTHKFSVGGHEGYITVGLFDDKSLGEIFLTMSKEGSTISGLMDTIATLTSIAVQYGVPLQVLIDRFAHTRFEPSGYTGNPELPQAKSVVDYVFRWLGLFSAQDEFISSGEFCEVMAELSDQTLSEVTDAQDIHDQEIFLAQSDSPPCHICGSITVRSGSCYACMNCGATTGCG